VRSGLRTPRTILIQLHAVGVVPAVLLSDVVALFALYASQRDLWPNVGGLGSHGVSVFVKVLKQPASCALTVEWQAMTR